MKHLRDGVFPLTIGLLITTCVGAPFVSADEYIGGAQINRVDAHCAQYGSGFVDLGNGLCGRMSRHVRVYVGVNRIEAPVDQRMNGWPANGTASAALRSDNAVRTDGMLPGAEANHVRVRGGLDAFAPFR